jgi:hypothetical protein
LDSFQLQRQQRQTSTNRRSGARRRKNRKNFREEYFEGGEAKGSRRQAAEWSGEGGGGGDSNLDLDSAWVCRQVRCTSTIGGRCGRHLNSGFLVEARGAGGGAGPEGTEQRNECCRGALIQGPGPALTPGIYLLPATKPMIQASLPNVAFKASLSPFTIPRTSQDADQYSKGLPTQGALPNTRDAPSQPPGTWQ